jgi:hypothetical protein
MRKYIIERAIAGAGELTPEQMREAGLKSEAALRELGPDVQWLHSYVTAGKIYCVYVARNPELVREHARRAGIPADLVSEVKAVVDLASA